MQIYTFFAIPSNTNRYLDTVQVQQPRKATIGWHRRQVPAYSKNLQGLCKCSTFVEVLQSNDMRN